MSDFKLQATISPELKKDFLCNDNETIEFNGLSCDTNYNVSIVWKSSSNMYCIFSHNKVPLACKPNKGNKFMNIVLIAIIYSYLMQGTMFWP